MNVLALRRLDLESSLRKALDRDEFTLHYQPQKDIQGGRITGFEALLRWNKPESGYIPPSEYIPLTEETGLILPSRRMGTPDRLCSGEGVARTVESRLDGFGECFCAAI